jgi:hypothetical protein
VILENYDICFRLDGPGAPLSVDTPAPGTMAIVARQLANCIPTTSGLPSLVMSMPTVEGVIDLSPMISLGKVSREVEDETFKDTVDSLFGVFGGRFNTTVEMVLEKFEERKPTLDEEFGEGEINFDALDALDLSGYPFVVSRFRANYHRIFESYEAYTTLVSDLVTGGQWNVGVVDALYQAIQEPESEPIHALERWYWHAIVTLAVPALQAYVQG